MRDALIFVLVVAVAVLGYLLHLNSVAVSDQRHQITDLSNKLEVRAKTTDVELQEKCAKQARLQLIDGGWKEPEASETNHFNEKLSKCFILIWSEMANKPSDGSFWINEGLYDAFEQKEYGEYIWKSAKTKSYRDVPPLQCDVTLPSGEKRLCHSLDEFQELTKVYMQ